MKKTITVILGILLLIMPGCKDSASPAAPISTSRVIESMDTVMKLTAYGENSAAAVDAAVEEINRLNDLLSTENPTGEVATLNRTGSAILSEDTAYLAEQSIKYYQATNGYFDFSIYPLSCIWGFPKKDYRVPAQSEIDTTLMYIGADRILFDPSSNEITLGSNQEIDFGGIAKGFTSQRVMEIFQQAGIQSAIVSLGGNVQCLGTKTNGSYWNVGVQDPHSGSSIVAVLRVADKAVITSGGYERFFVDDATGKEYKHILDPKTGYPVENDLASVTIVADDGTMADAYSTALFAMGLDVSIDFWRNNPKDFDVIWIDSEGTIYVTAGIRDSVSSDKTITVIE